MYMPFFDPTMLLLIPVFIFALWAQAKVKSAFNKWSRVPTSQGITGAAMAKMILEKYGLYKIPVKETEGELTDNYNPVNKTLNLSESVYSSDSVAAVGIAAHEAGHAIQHNKGYFPLAVRNAIYPVANIGSTLAFPLFFIGLIFGYNKFLMDLGIWLFIGFTAFTVITLPVEFDASRRAVVLLKNSGYFTTEEIAGVKEVLNAAALTYVAAVLSALVNLIRLLLIRGSDD